MKSTPLVVLLVAALALPPGRVAASPQASATPAGQELPTFGVGTAAVTLDVVVRDKKGHAVRDLKASDFEVFEEGVKQTIESFRLFGSPSEGSPVVEPPKAAVAPATPAAAPAAAPPAAAPGAEIRPQLIAFIFDRLAPEARNQARKAALAYLDKGHVEGDLVGVFSIDLSLQTILPFTREPGLIRAGLDRAASQGNTDFANNREAARTMTDSLTSSELQAAAATSAAPTGPGAGAAGQQVAAGAASSAISGANATFQVQMLRSFEALERDQQGYATTNGLLAVVNGLKDMPGRKTVVFFSEGMVIPVNVQAKFRDVIHSANRAHVSIYAMDAGGLRAASMNKETRDEINQAAARRIRQLDSGRDDASNGLMSRNLERNEDILRFNPESGLSQLANETGGFLIRDTNDSGSAFRRIQEDMRFHYLLSYSPINEAYDGRFRNITVKLARAGLEVQTRKGYFAVRPAEPNTQPLLSYEALAIAQLDRPARPDAFPVSFAGLAFPEAKRPGLVPLLVEVAGSRVAYTPDKGNDKMQHADLVIVVRVKDQLQHEVDRLSQHYQLSAATADLEKARKGDILFYREAELPPGKYTIEAVAYDGVAEKASVRSRSLEVRAADDRLARLSSVVLVRRVEKVGESEQKNGPLYYGDTLLYPNMGEPFKKSAKVVGFYFSVLPAKDGPTPAKATVEVWHGGQAVGQVVTDLPAPGPQGRIQHAGALPLSAFGPGAYEIKVTVPNGPGVAATSSSSAAFTVEE
jgi:VWFA-related protein